MNILGVHWEQCSTAAMMVDGQVVACVSEERFSRRKNDDAYPKKAIEYCLEAAGLRPNDLDVVAVASERWDPTYLLCHRSSYSVRDRLREQHEYWYPRMYKHRLVNYLEAFSDKLDMDQYPGSWDDVVAFLRKGSERGSEEAKDFFQSFRRTVISGHLGVKPDRVVFPHHHRSHAHYAYFGSPVDAERALVLTADAWGDDMNGSVSVAERGRGIHVLSTSNNFNLARLYRSITLLLGMKPDEHEFKVMGLAASSSPRYFQGPLDVFRETLFVDGLGFSYRVVPPDLYVYFRQRLEGYRFDAIAGALQRYTEEIVTEWARNALVATGARQLCFGGGLAMNVKAMMEVAKLAEADAVHVCPSPSDESLAIGACYAAMSEVLEKGADPRNRLHPLPNAYLGPDLAPPDIRSAIAGAGADYTVTDRVTSAAVARALAAGKLVGRCAGRSEFGARALGNRSILADPRDIRTVKRLNEKVKSRDFWMPFAPSVVEARARDYLVNPKCVPARYMTVGFETTAESHRDLPATLHPADSTARPQVVTRADNASYHAVITEFEKLTGVGALLNTSFNIHGEPIVQTAADAIDVFRRSDLDALVLGDVFVEKRSNPALG